MNKRLFNKSERSYLLEASGFVCESCGTDLNESNFHADHVIPHSLGGRTHVMNGQALCAACNLAKGDYASSGPIDYSLVFRPGEGFREQKGQEKIWSYVASVNHNIENRILAELCTGYGKSLLAYGAFAILKARGIADTMLVLVPRDTQRQQFLDDSEDARRLLGIESRPLKCTGDGFEKREILSGSKDILIATYNQLLNNVAQERVEGKKLFIVVDECHKMGDGGSFASKANEIDRRFTLFMTATPYRRDRKVIVGCPSKPIVRITYKDAYTEGCVRRIYGKSEHFKIVAVGPGCEKIELTTEDLASIESSEGFVKYEARMKLRYDETYVDQMCKGAIEELVARNKAHPKQHKMVVFAMTCKHASFVCSQLQGSLKKSGSSLKVDWVGVNEGEYGEIKSAKECSEIVDRFRHGDLDILVQVDKASEGFSVKKASVLVFMNLIKFDGRLVQQVGRGVRRNPAIPFNEDSCVVFSSADSPVAEMVLDMEQEIKELVESTVVISDPEKDKKRTGGGGRESILSMYVEHDKTTLHGDLLTPAQRELCARFNVPEDEMMKANGIDVEIRNEEDPAESRFIDERELLKDRVNEEVSKLAAIIEANAASSGVKLDQSSNTWKQIHKAWSVGEGRGHKLMTSQDFERKISWLVNHRMTCGKSGWIPGFMMIVGENGIPFPAYKRKENKPWRT